MPAAKRTYDAIWDRMAAAVERDPAGRGLSRLAASHRPAPAEVLRSAAESLAQEATVAAIVTGFPIVSANPSAAETDGPPGALVLARVLVDLGSTVVLISDPFGAPLLAAGCDFWGLDRSIILEFPFEEGAPDAPARCSNEARCNLRSDEWVDRFLASDLGRRLSHIIAIERPGPSHTAESLAGQPRDGPAPEAEFDAHAPPEGRDLCHNMWGRSINGYTAKTHRLLEEIERRGLAVRTIAVADGGNELGMGSIAWEAVRQAIGGENAGRIVSRIAADDLILAGVSNWGGYALAVGACHARGRLDLLAPLTIEAEQALIVKLVEDAGAVDGMTARPQATVDGLAPDDYFAVLTELRAAVGM